MAANFKIADPVVGAPLPVTQTATYATNSLPWALGLVVRAIDRNSGSDNLGAGVFQFCVGSDVVSAGQWVQIQGNTAVLLNVNNSASYFPIGVAAGNLSATNVYGWVQIAGLCDLAKGNSESSVAAGENLYIGTNSDVPGFLIPRNGTDVSGTATVWLGLQVNGVCAPVSYTSAQSDSFTVQLNYPQVLGLTGSI